MKPDAHVVMNVDVDLNTLSLEQLACLRMALTVALARMDLVYESKLDVYCEGYVHPSSLDKKGVD